MKREHWSGLQGVQPGKEGEGRWEGSSVLLRVSPVTCGEEWRAERREQTAFPAECKLLEGFQFLFCGLWQECWEEERLISPVRAPLISSDSQVSPGPTGLMAFPCMPCTASCLLHMVFSLLPPVATCLLRCISSSASGSPCSGEPFQTLFSSPSFGPPACAAYLVTFFLYGCGLFYLCFSVLT